jgi:hypothetical protein
MPVHSFPNIFDFVGRQMLNSDKQVACLAYPDQLVDLGRRAELSRFCDVWIRKTMRNVMTLVSVFMTNCHESEMQRPDPRGAMSAPLRGRRRKRPDIQTPPLCSWQIRQNAWTMVSPDEVPRRCSAARVPPRRGFGFGRHGGDGAERRLDPTHHHEDDEDDEDQAETARRVVSSPNLRYKAKSAGHQSVATPI